MEEGRMSAGADVSCADRKMTDTASAPSVRSMRDYDLTERMSPFLDTQMLIAQLKWLKTAQLYSDEEIAVPAVEALNQTAFGAAEWKFFGVERPQEHIAEHSKDTEKRAKLEQDIRQFVKCMSEVRKERMNEACSLQRAPIEQWCRWYQKRLLDAGEISPGTDISFPEDGGAKWVAYCKMSYINNIYEQSTKMLAFYIDYVCAMTPDGLSLEKVASATWGLLASLILSLPAPTPLNSEDVDRVTVGRIDEAAVSAVATAQPSNDADDSIAVQIVAAIKDLDNLIEDQLQFDLYPVQVSTAGSAGIASEGLPANSLRKSNISAAAMQKINQKKKVEYLVRKSWLLHWALWPIFRYYLPRVLSGGKATIVRHACWAELIDWLVQEKNLATVQMICPHLLRYYAVLLVTLPNFSKHEELTVQTLHSASTSGKYSDPVTRWVQALYHDLDFTVAQALLEECTSVVKIDFFLSGILLGFEQCARLKTFERHCCVHRSISIDMIAKKLNMSATQAEMWVVALIRNSKLDANIDSERNRIEFETGPRNIYKQVLEKANGVEQRSRTLIQQILSK